MQPQVHGVSTDYDDGVGRVAFGQIGAIGFVLMYECLVLLCDQIINLAMQGLDIKRCFRLLQKGLARAK